MKRCLIVTLLLLILPLSAFAQWTNIANIGLPYSLRGNYGAITYKDGILWAAVSDVRMSTDLGKTWQLKFNIDSARVYGLDFFDQNTGAVADDSGVYITHDQGQSWTLALRPSFDPVSVRFGATQSDVFVSTENYTLWVSNDGGLTWNSEPSDSWTQDIAILPDSSVLVFESNNLGYLYRSTDHGATWNELPGNTGFDSWSIGVAGCGAQTYYVVNEQNAGSNGNSSELWVTTDAGVHWNATLISQSGELRGAIATAGQYVFVPTRSSGIMRSNDSGQTWKSIGGPEVNFDSRQIAAVSENVLFATDEFGNLYITTNSGGDSVIASAGFVGVMPASISYPDSVQLCAGPAKQFVQISKNCNSPSVIRSGITGADSIYFTSANSPSFDTIFVYFSPNENRGYSASLQISLSNGSMVTVPLSGYGKSYPPASVSSQPVTNDTIGATVYLPIVFYNPGPNGNLDLSVHFDSSFLVYVGTYPSNGSNQDQTLSHSATTSRLHFDSTALVAGDSVIGYVQFEIFPNSSPCTDVRFDSVSLLSDGMSCVSINSSFDATICSAVSCETFIMSNVLRYGKLPSFNIIPDPASNATFIHTDTAIGEAEIEVCDMLGNIRTKAYESLSPSNPVELDLSALPAGAYAVRVLTGNFEQMLNIVVIK